MNIHKYPHLNRQIDIQMAKQTEQMDKQLAQANEQTYGHTDEQTDEDRSDGLTVGQTYMWTD